LGANGVHEALQVVAGLVGARGADAAQFLGERFTLPGGRKNGYAEPILRQPAAPMPLPPAVMMATFSLGMSAPV
jgi:hypothetical protein